MRKYISLFFVLFMTTKLFAMDVSRTMGKDTAPVVIEEFSSLTCPHCAAFHLNIYPRLEEEYIKTGKVRLIYRNYPLGNAALAASMLALSIPKKQFFPFIGYVYFYQRDLQKNPQKTLQMWAKKLKLNFEKVMNNQQLLTAINKDLKRIEKTKNIQGTPLIIIAGKEYEGDMTPKDFFGNLDRIYTKVK